MNNIKTGVDKLVDLVSQKKKISVDEAAKTLGVGKEVVQEWAEFLEEEGLVTIEYSLSKAWIMEKKITKEDVITGAKELSSQRDAFARKIEVAITSLDQETSGFEEVRKEFVNIQSHIKSEIDTVKNQLSELEKYDALKSHLDKEISRQKDEYDKVVKDAAEKLKLESLKYDELRVAISKEHKNIEQFSQKINELKAVRTDYERTINTLNESLKNINNILYDQSKKLDTSTKNIQNFKDLLDKLDKDLSEKKESVIMQKVNSLKSDYERLFKNQQEMDKDLREKIKGLKSYDDVSSKIHKSFEGFFLKNINTEKLIAEIENDKEGLKKELETMKNKILTFNILATNSNVKSQIKEIEEILKNYEHKKIGIKYKIEKLIATFKGK